MSTTPESVAIDQFAEDESARSFCTDFLAGAGPRYVFGRNEYAASIGGQVDLAGFVDDFTHEKEFAGKQIIRTGQLPENALIVSAVVLGRPLTVRNKLRDRGLRQLDYFAFRKYSGLDIIPVMFWDGFPRDFEVNRDRYDALYRLLQDEQSRRELARLLNFRLSGDLNYMEGFQDIQYRQYFEDFLELKPDGEVFVDVGCYDGYTTTEFIRRCPGYASIHVFEPEPGNMEVIRNNLADYPRIHFHPYGLSNRAQTLKFMAQGSASRISSEGDQEIRVERLDDTLVDPFSFLKIDIEGGELPALEGARQAIARHRPRLAISAYHRHDDLWRIPAQVLSCRDDYRVFLRHYTEGVTETVMFFVPNK